MAAPTGAGADVFGAHHGSHDAGQAVAATKHHRQHGDEQGNERSGTRGLHWGGAASILEPTPGFGKRRVEPLARPLTTW